MNTLCHTIFASVVVVVVVTGVELLAGAPKLGKKRLETKRVLKKNIRIRFLSKSHN